MAASSAGEKHASSEWYSWFTRVLSIVPHWSTSTNVVVLSLDRDEQVWLLLLTVMIIEEEKEDEDEENNGQEEGEE